MNARSLLRVKLFSLSLILLAIACVLALSQAKTSAQKDVLKEFAAYKTWTRVNAKPHPSNNFQIEGQDS